MWSAIALIKQILTEKRGKTICLLRTRQKYQRDGARKTIYDIAIRSGTSEGFKILERTGRLELTFEAIIICHPDLFAPDDIDFCKQKLLEAGCSAAQIET